MTGGAMGEKLESFNQRLHQPRNIKRLSTAILGVWASAVLTADLKLLSDPCFTNEEACRSVEPSALEEAVYLRDPDLSNELASGVHLAMDNGSAELPVTTTTTERRRPALEMGLQLDPAVEEAMNSMELSSEGYELFLNSIDTSHLAFAQTFREFNPELLASEIHQGPSQIFVLHFTVNYANPDHIPLEQKYSPIGEFNVRRMITGMAAQYGHGGKCCGVNWMIGRGARTYQTAPLNAKLNHNPPYNEIITGVEIEAHTQANITTEQYRSAAYLAVAVLDTQGLLGNHALGDILKGHGEMRDPIIDDWNAANPNSRLGVRDDFNYAESQLFRHYVQELLDNNPGIVGRRPLAGHA